MSKRVDVKTGFLCNNNCIFCVQAHKKKFGNRTTEELKKDLKASRQNCDSVVFTGGEVTIRGDLLELVSYAKELGYCTIQIQSNSRMLAYKSLCEEIIKAGANEFSPALHGHIPELHDYLTGSKGSFLQTVQAIKNLRELDQYILTNTVVTKANYRYLPDLAKLFVKLKVDQFQFAFPHAIGNADKNFDQVVPFVSMAAPYIHKGLQVGIDAGIKVMAEAMPYCVMKGYERYVSEKFIPQAEIRDVDDFVLNWEDSRKNDGKIKFPQCKKCKYDKICEGPWREYPERRGSDEFQPIL
jgi:MoaA/NifB/PqqE/SkfB family radical SAM enzyme